MLETPLAPIARHEIADRERGIERSTGLFHLGRSGFVEHRAVFETFQSGSQAVANRIAVVRVAGDVGAARRSVIDDHHAVHHHGRVKTAHRAVRNDERRARAVAPDHDVPTRRLEAILG